MQTEQETIAVCDPDTLELDHFESPLRISPRQHIETGHGATPSMLALSAAIGRAQYETQTWPRVRQASPTDPRLVCKRIIDVLGAVLILVMISPVLAVCAALVLISSPGPVFFKSRRVGLGGRSFFMWKLRTMCANTDQALEKHFAHHPEARSEWNATHKLINDPRVTPIGRTMRRFSLDELPQLFNVIKGEMSLVGPRPLLPEEVCKYGRTYHNYTRFRPGMTGLWQVSGRNNTAYERRVQLAEYYLQNWSIRLDTSILLQTVRVVLTGEGAY